MQKLLTFSFSKNISIYAIFSDQSFNDTLTNDIVVLNIWALVFSAKFCIIINIYSSGKSGYPVG